MAVKIRLARYGKKKKPFYRIVVADERFSRNGRFLEKLGTYNPLKDPAEISVEKERVEHWLNEGALMTDTVRTLLRQDTAAAPQNA
ncbi:MAG: 30S ribosomal protein S16 [Thermodesulfobacteriota bacterium]|nr:30S ribosomal protein S16 [Thermodesulfobacteriota bacterium]